MNGNAIHLRERGSMSPVGYPGTVFIHKFAFFLIQRPVFSLEYLYLKLDDVPFFPGNVGAGFIVSVTVQDGSCSVFFRYVKYLLCG